MMALAATFLRWQPMVLQASVFRRDVWLGEGGLDARFRLKHDTDLFALDIGHEVCAVSRIAVFTEMMLAMFA